MAERLIPCAACSRHVKSSDATCPFCQAPMVALAAPGVEPFRRMAAAAAVAAGVVALTGCSSSSGSGSPGSGDDASVSPGSGDDASVVVFYGVPSFDDAAVRSKDASFPVDQDAAPDTAVDGASDAGDRG